MKLSCALVACNDNPKYLDFWPIVKRAWWDIVGIPCVMVYVAETIPDTLTNDSAVIHFQPIQGWPTATQAQVIRLLYPALLKCDGAVVLSDMDIIPMKRDFFVQGFEQFQPHQLVSLRGIDEEERQVYMCYVGATPQTWRDCFGIQSVNDIQIMMTNWAAHVQADGSRGGKGWCTDQLILYQAFIHWKMNFPDRIGCLPWTKEIPRLCRTRPSEWLEWNHTLQLSLQYKYYVDFHMPHYDQWKDHIEKIYSYLLLHR